MVGDRLNVVTIVDLETTGLDYKVDRILEFGGIRMVDDKPDSEFHALVNPGVKLKESNIAIHGITAEMVAECPRVEEVLPQFLEFLGNTPIVAHNAVFDYNFLNHNAQISLGREVCNHVIDTSIMARELFPREKALSLERLLTLLGKSAEGLHRALQDARALASVFPDLARLYEDKLEWHRSRFAIADALANRYLQVSTLVEELKLEEWEMRRTLELLFSETSRSSIEVPGGGTLKLEKRESWEFHAEEVRALLSSAGILDRVTRVDRAKLDRYLKGDRLSQLQKEAILATRRFLGYRPHLTIERPT